MAIETPVLIVGGSLNGLSLAADPEKVLGKALRHVLKLYRENDDE